MVASFASFAIGYALFLRTDLDPSYPLMVLPTMLLLGLGFGLGFPSITMLATSGVEDHEQGVASGLVNTSFQLGGALVLAIVSAVVGGGAVTPDEAASFLDAAHTAVGVVTGVAALGLVVALTGVAWRRRLGAALAVERAGA
jgi:sugar phosphate permease